MSVVAHSIIGEISAAATAKAHTVIVKTVADVKSAAQGKAPVDTGALKGSITGRTGGLEGKIEVGVDYGVYVEFGSSHGARTQSGATQELPGSSGMFSTTHAWNISAYNIAAQPFLTPAAEEQRAAYYAAMGQVFAG